MPINSKEWINGVQLDFNTDGGDKEQVLAWINDSYVKEVGFVGMRLEAILNSKLSITETGQIVHRSIGVLTQTDFVKAMKALNLDLSSYKCS